jgi:hypothetical protein
MFRINNYLSAVWWNCVAAYSTDFKDALTKERPTVFAPDTNIHTTYYRSACLAQATATYAELAMPNVNPAFFNFMARHSKISVQRPISILVSRCKGRDACYQQLVRTVGYSPSFMGQIIGKKVHDFSLQDGFNELGTDDCSVNCRPYMDTVRNIIIEVHVLCQLLDLVWLSQGPDSFCLPRLDISRYPFPVVGRPMMSTRIDGNHSWMIMEEVITPISRILHPTLVPRPYFIIYPRATEQLE